MKERIVEFYNRAADHYDDGTKRSGYFALEWIARHVHELESLPECRVLDLGCGTGSNVKVLSERRPGIRAEGVDISPRMIERARATGRYQQLYTHDLNGALPALSADSFDLVMAFGLMELLSDVTVCLSECRRVLKANGKLWITFRRFEYQDEGSPPRSTVVAGMTTTGYTAAEILHMMKSLDLRVTTIEPIIAYITRAGFAYPYYVLQVQKTR